MLNNWSCQVLLKTLCFTYFFESEYMSFTHSNTLSFPLQLLLPKKKNRGVYDCIHLILQKSSAKHPSRTFKIIWQHVVHNILLAEPFRMLCLRKQ